MERKPKILLIDDDADLIELAKMVLAKRPYDVLAAYSGEEGLEKAKADTPDLIILDVIMPVMDGFTVCQQLKASPETARIPVIMLTGFSEKVGESTVAVSQGLTLDAVDYLEKPLDGQQLLERVEFQLRRLGFIQ